MASAGRHIVLDLYNCNYDIISDQDKIKDLIKDCVCANSLELKYLYVQSGEDNTGFSLIAFFRHGHIIVHALPEAGFAAVDIFSSLDNILLDKIAIKIKQGLRSEKAKITHLRRGDFGSLNDMKPSVSKKTKTWRRVRNTSAKVWKTILDRHQQNRSEYLD